MFGAKWKKQLRSSLAVNIGLVGLLEEACQYLPEDKRKELEHKAEVLVVKHTETVDGEVKFR
ncbi:hypothetical protein [Bacillus phage vB_BceM_Bc431v3]|uniref:Uncharacterized protein n=1 Tax=Bacillus phage vB_BceM_Bc431v3 TaxID=1195072 RepID=M4HPZ0_9CAUD|nr:hypothetical protein K201_gp097 [Bacillus phage vB_BceM_Bc431v3]AFQ96405.1 hypothetical protein [Bacillus phage vB_BceM_Bc431v3]